MILLLIIVNVINILAILFIVANMFAPETTIPYWVTFGIIVVGCFIKIINTITIRNAKQRSNESLPER